MAIVWQIVGCVEAVTTPVPAHAGFTKSIVPSLRTRPLRKELWDRSHPLCVHPHNHGISFFHLKICGPPGNGASSRLCRLRNAYCAAYKAQAYTCQTTFVGMQHRLSTNINPPTLILPGFFTHRLLLRVRCENAAKPAGKWKARWSARARWPTPSSIGLGLTRQVSPPSHPSGSGQMSLHACNSPCVGYLVFCFPDEASPNIFHKNHLPGIFPQEMEPRWIDCCVHLNLMAQNPKPPGRGQLIKYCASFATRNTSFAQLCPSTVLLFGGIVGCRGSIAVQEQYLSRGFLLRVSAPRVVCFPVPLLSSSLIFPNGDWPKWSADSGTCWCPSRCTRAPALTHAGKTLTHAGKTLHMNNSCALAVLRSSPVGCCYVSSFNSQ